MNNRIIKNASLTEIDRAGNMLFEWPEAHKSIGTRLWLCGWNRPSNIKIGDVGTLEYRVTPSYGLWFFGKDGQL